MEKNGEGRREAILAYIKKSLQERGYPPSVREIGEAVGLRSTSTVHAHLRRLEARGLIKRDPSRPRAIDIAARKEISERLVEIPVVGMVTAGLPILAEQNIEGKMPLPAAFAGNEGNFMLRVRGDSMIEAGIYDGDLVIVKPGPGADNGDIVVALLDNEATVKRFFKEKGYIRLQPENQRYSPIISRDVKILGKVIGLLRTY